MGLRVAGSRNVTQFHVWQLPRAVLISKALGHTCLHLPVAELQRPAAGGRVSPRRGEEAEWACETGRAAAGTCRPAAGRRRRRRPCRTCRRSRARHGRGGTGRARTCSPAADTPPPPSASTAHAHDVDRRRYCQLRSTVADFLPRDAMHPRY